MHAKNNDKAFQSILSTSGLPVIVFCLGIPIIFNTDGAISTKPGFLIPLIVAHLLDDDYQWHKV